MSVISQQVYQRSLDNLLEPLQPLIKDAEIQQIIINGVDDIYVDRGEGGLQRADTQFRGQPELMALAQGIAQYMGATIGPETPHLDGQLPDGSRVHVVVPPVVQGGVHMTILKPTHALLSIEDMIAKGTLTEEMGDYLLSCVRSKHNIVVTGGSGDGKTTMVRALSSWIPEKARVVVVEDTSELQLEHPHTVCLRGQPTWRRADGDTAQRHQRDLLDSGLKLCPDYLFFGDLASPAVFSMLQAMAYGSGGIISTLQARTPQGALRRLESLVCMDGNAVPRDLMREQLVEAIQVLVQLKRTESGQRKVTEIVSLEGWDTSTNAYRWSVIGS